MTEPGYEIIKAGIKTVEGSGVFQRWVEARSADDWEVQLDVSDDAATAHEQILAAFRGVREAFGG